MALEILIGRNKTGKTTYLEKLANAKKDNSLYLPAEIKYEDFFSKNNLGTAAKPIIPPHQMVLNFINDFLSTKVNYTLTNEEKEKYNSDIQSFQKIIKEIKNIQSQDDYIESALFDSFKINNELNDNPAHIDVKMPNVFDFGCDKNISSEFSSGSSNYSLLKFISLFLFNTQVKIEKNFSIFVDEPEKFLHPELIQKMADEIYKLSKVFNVVIATHSIQIVERIIYKNYADKEEINYTYFSPHENKEESILKINIKDNIKDLNYREISMIVKYLFSTNCILVEGVADQDFIESLRNDYFKDDYITILDTNSRSGVEKIAKKIILLTGEQQNRKKLPKLMLFYDNDVVAGENNEWNVLKEPINIEINENISSLIQKPDLEKCFFDFKEKPKSDNNKNNDNKKPNYEYLIKEDKSVQKKELTIEVSWIKENSTKVNIDEIIKGKGEAIQNWIKGNLNE